MPSDTPHSSNNVPFIDAILPGLGGMLAGGLFLLPAMATDVAGPAALVSLLIASGVALALSRLSVSPDAPRHSFVRFAASLMGVAMRVAAAAVLAVVLAAYMCPHAPETSLRAIAAVAVVIATAVVIAGVRPSPSAVAIATGVAIVGLGFFIGLAAPLVERPSLVPFAPHGWTAIPSTAGLLFFLFGGTEYVRCLSDVLVRPKRTIPQAAVLGTILMAAVSLLVLFVSVGVGGPAFTTHRLFVRAEDHAPLLAIGMATGRPIALWGLRLGAVVSSAVAIHRLILEAAESCASMARLGDLPGALGNVLPRGDAPWAAALLTGVLAVGLAAGAPLATIVVFAAGALLLGYAFRLAARGTAWFVGTMVGLLILTPPAAWRWVGAVACLAVIGWKARGLWKPAS